METQPATKKMPPPDGTVEDWRAQKTLVWASHCLVTLRTFYRQTLSLAYGFVPFEIAAPGLPGSICILYIIIHTY